jgi:hypothetical protein
MFNTEEDYFNATKYAEIYRSSEIKSSSNKLLIFNFISLALLGYMTFSYLESDKNIFSEPVVKEAVLGVSETVDGSKFANEKFVEVLKGIEVETLQNSMKVLMNESTIRSQSSYPEAISTVLDDRSGFKGRIAVVNQKEVSFKD